MASVDEIVARPYTRAVERGEDGVFTAWILEMPGCIAEGDTADEALANVDGALRLYVESMLEDGQRIPEPFRDQRYSGRLQLRLTPALHRRAALYAEQQGVSLNRVLAEAVATYVADGTRREAPDVAEGTDLRAPKPARPRSTPRRSSTPGRGTTGGARRQSA